VHSSNSPGSVTINGNLSEWTAESLIDRTLSVAGYDIYAKWTGDTVAFALSAPVAIGGNTTAWLNTDQDASTGFQIFGVTGGAEFNVNFTPSGTPRLYTGNAAQNLIPTAVIDFATSADRRIVEFQVPLSAIGSPEAINTLWDINNTTFLPTDYSLTQYSVITSEQPPVVGSVTMNGRLDDWVTVERIDQTLSVPDYAIFAQVAGDSLVFALESPIAIGANTTVWLNADRNAATGFQVFGNTGGAEFNIDFDANGVPHLYTGNAGQNLVAEVRIPFGSSNNHNIVEFAVPLSAIGSPSAVDTLWDVNDVTFLPTNFSATQYTAPAPRVIGSVTLDGSLAEWTPADAIDQTLSITAHDIFARITEGSLVFGLRAPVPIGANTTAWLNTDQDASTGFQIFGFAGGTEFNIDFDANGVPHLYTGNAGQTLVPNALVSFATSADRTIAEFSVELSDIGSPDGVNTLWDINDLTFLPTDFSATQYTVGAGATPPPPPPAPVVGSITLDGSLADWNTNQQIDSTLSVPGYDIYAQATGGSLVFALQAPTAIGANTTAWLNTDQNAATGFQIFGFAGGAEFNVNFDAAGTPHLFTGNAGETPVAGATVAFGANADRTILEFAVPLSAIGSPDIVTTLWDVNDTTFLPTSFALAQYEVVVTPRSPIVGSVNLDGNLGEWTVADQIDDTLSVDGFDIFAKTTGGSLVFALDAPAVIGPNTTVWMDTDANPATGFQVFGFAGGAEFNINFDAVGTPHLYTGNAGQTLVAGAPVSFAFSADRTAVEFAVPLSAIGSPAVVSTLWDVNDSTFLPTDFSLTRYDVFTTSTPSSGTLALRDVLAPEPQAAADPGVFIDFAETPSASTSPIALASVVTANVLQDVPLVA
jgi:serralysin